MGFYLWDPYPWRPLCQSGCLSHSVLRCLLPSFLPYFLSFHLPFSVFVFLSVRVSVCQSSVPSIWSLHDKNLSLKPDEPGPGYSEPAPPAGWRGREGEFMGPARWYVPHIRTLPRWCSYVRNMQLMKPRCFSPPHHTITLRINSILDFKWNHRELSEVRQHHVCHMFVLKFSGFIF